MFQIDSCVFPFVALARVCAGWAVRECPMKQSSLLAFVAVGKQAAESREERQVQIAKLPVPDGPPGKNNKYSTGTAPLPAGNN